MGGSGRGGSRRWFLVRAGAGVAGLLGGSATRGAACDVAVTGERWPSVEGWEHRTLAHFANTILPGDHARPLVPRDRHPLDAGGDTTAGAWSACALDVFYHPFHGVGRDTRRLALALDGATLLLGHGLRFYRASQAQQLEVVDALARTIAREDLRRAAALVLAGTLGAAVNHAVTAAIGWAGPNGGHYDGGRHPVTRWRQPERLTADGNLP
jgi:hypothetical protein